MIVAATRLHGPSVLRDDPTLNKLRVFLDSASAYADHIAVAVSLTLEDRELFDAVTAVASECVGVPVTIVPVTFWGKFTPALNALTAHAATLSGGGECQILFQSIEMVCSPEIVQSLRNELTESVLVCGAALEGHVFSTMPTATLDGRSCPWNTLALWSVARLTRTGFLSVSDGSYPGVDAGVEEVACVAAQQKLFPGSAEAVLVRLPPGADLSWGKSSGAERSAAHEKKMKSKVTRAASQLRALGMADKPGFVRHVDGFFDDVIRLDPEVTDATIDLVTTPTDEKPAVPAFSYVEPSADSRFSMVLVTGGAGFIGSHTAERLLRRGNSVVIVDTFNDYYDVAQKQANIAHLHGVLAQCRDDFPEGPSRPTLHVIRGNICDHQLMGEVFQKYRPRQVVHLAARAGVRPSLEDPHIYVQTNLAGTTVLLENSRLHGVTHFVYASSSSVYGGSTAYDFTERDVVDAPVSPYAATKKATELMASTFTHLYGLPTSGLRFFTVYGPRGRPDMAPYKFIQRAVQGVAIDQYGDGTSERDYTHIDDIVDGVVRTMDRPAGCQVYNLGRGTPITLKDFIGLVGSISTTEMKINMMPDQPGDVKRTCADITKARTMLNYQPAVSFERGLKETFAWFMETLPRRTERKREQEEEKVKMLEDSFDEDDVDNALSKKRSMSLPASWLTEMLEGKYSE